MKTIDSIEALQQVTTLPPAAGYRRVYRGQPRCYEKGIMPSAARKGSSLWSKDFDGLHDDLRPQWPWIKHKHVATFYERIVSDELWGDPRAIKRYRGKDADKRVVLNFLVQALFQHYGRKCLFVDVTDCLEVALFFATHDVEACPSDSEDDLPAKTLIQTSEQNVHLFVFDVPLKACLEGSSLDHLVRRFRAREKIRASVGNALLLDPRRLLRRCTRLTSQRASLLTRTPLDDFDHGLYVYDVQPLVTRHLVIARETALACVRKSGMDVPRLFPRKDRVYEYADRYARERERIRREGVAPADGTDAGLSVVDWVEACM